MDPLNRFKNIWEIEQNFKCPVVGTLLSIDKHRQILKKCGWDVTRMKPYEYHSTLMACLGDENKVSVRVNNVIRHQARQRMTEVAGLFEKKQAHKVAALWKAALLQGEVGPVLYAIISHPDAGGDLLHDIHGEVHLKSHANMTEVFEIRKQVQTLHTTLAHQKEKISEFQGRIRELVRGQKSEDGRVLALTTENGRLKARIAALESRNLSGEDLDRQYRETISGLLSELAAQREEAQEARQRENKMQIELFSARNENQVIRTEMADLVAALSKPAQAQAQAEKGCPAAGLCTEKGCPEYKICASRVLMVGGMTKMQSYYRDIVEKAGGQFDYHDGYMKHAGDNLAARVRRCDLVVCPVNCNSHNACLKVKKLCRRYNKALKILDNASLSAVTQALLVPETAAVN